MTHEMVPADAPVRPQRAPMMAGGRPMPIVPQSMEDCFRLANAVVAAGMAPRGLETAEKAMVAMMHGLEVGLTPMAALQRIAVVNGRPTIWGDGAVGLVRGSGLCEWIRENVAGEGDAMVATCEAKRRGDPEAIKRTFSVADARKAQLWNKQGPWQQFPTRMLAMRARAFCLRDGFADVLGGLYLKEEIDNGDDDRQQRRAPSPASAALDHQPAPALPAPERQPEPATAQTGRRAPSPTAAAPQPTPAAPVQQAATAPQTYDPEAVRKRFAAALAEAKSQDDINTAWDEIIDPVQDLAMAPDREDWERMVRLREGEICGTEGAMP